MQGNSFNSNKERGDFRSWVENENMNIRSYLLAETKEFLSQHTNSDIPNLILDNRWHYIGKDKKAGYKGEELTDNNGVPKINFIYHSFKQGGHSEAFDSYKIIKDLWHQRRSGQELKRKPPFVSKAFKTSEYNKNTYYINKDLNLWTQLNEHGFSKYLNNKKLPNLKGIRFAQDFIAVRIINCKDEFFGLQKIYNDGKKIFTKGLEKKGNFALIGSLTLPIKLKTIHLCEGIATAGTIHLATLEPVFAALDASNLCNVLPKLKTQYPSANVIVWADNDQWKEGQIHNSKPLGNTGLIYANLAALKARNALVVFPDFSETGIQDKPTDFNDLYQLKGLDHITKSIPQRPDIKMALVKKLDKAISLQHGILSMNNFVDSKKSLYNSKYLPEDLEIFQGINLIRSPIGTGKTTIVENYLKSHPQSSVLFTTHLISLVENAAQRLSLKSYNECDAFDLQMQRKLAICLNSLNKLTFEGPLPSYDVLIIDEIEQVLSRLCTHLESKPLIFDILKNLVINTKTVICLDADLSKTTVDLIKIWCPDKMVNIHFNEYKVGQGREIIMYDDKESLQVTVVNELQNSSKIYLAFNSRKEAKKTYDLISYTFPNKKGLYISSTNNGDKNVISFFNDPNKESKKYDYIICTPSVSTGVSISNGHFNFVGGIFNTDINTPNDCMQALGRVRDSKKIHVFCDKKRGQYTLDSKLISSKWTETHKYDLALMGLNDLGDRVIINNEYEALCINVTQNKNRGKNDFYYEFCLLAAYGCYTFVYSPLTLEKNERKEVKDIKNYYHENSVQNNIINSSVIDSNTARLIEKKGRRTLQETLNYEKYQLVEFYKLNPYDDANIQRYATIDNQGQLKKQILNLELALADQNTAKQLFEKQYEESEQFVADLKHYALKQTIFKKLLGELKLVSKEGVFSYFEYSYTKQTILNGDFIKWVINNHQVIQGILPIPSIDSIQNNPITFISKLLSKLGLKQKRTGRAGRGIYMLDVDTIQLMKQLFEKRVFTHGNTCDNNIIYNTTNVPIRAVPQVLKASKSKIKKVGINYSNIMENIIYQKYLKTTIIE